YAKIAGVDRTPRNLKTAVEVGDAGPGIHVANLRDPQGSGNLLAQIHRTYQEVCDCHLTLTRERGRLLGVELACETKRSGAQVFRLEWSRPDRSIYRKLGLFSTVNREVEWKMSL